MCLLHELFFVHFVPFNRAQWSIYFYSLGHLLMLAMGRQAQLIATAVKCMLM